MRVHALTVDRGGCFYYRIRLPLTALRRRGHWTSWGAGLDELTWQHADVIVGQYLHHPATVDWWCHQAAKRDRLMVWEADDDIWNVTAVTGHGNAYDDPDTVPRMEQAIAAAHLVTVTTPDLAKSYAAVNPRVVVLPNALPDWLPDWRPPAVEGPFTIGYSCSPSHQEDLQWFAPTLAAVMAKTGARLRLYGPTSRPVGIPATWAVEAMGWRGDTAEYLQHLAADVGIAPLCPMPFNDGKSGIKALEYLALGIEPVVANWPQYRAVLPPGVAGRLGQLCRTQAEWIDALWRAASLPRDHPTRADAAAERRSWAREWTIGRRVAAWETAYRQGLEGL